MNEKKVITEDVEQKFVDMVLEFAENEKLTINNIKEAVEKAYIHMERNAVLKKTT